MSDTHLTETATPKRKHPFLRFVWVSLVALVIGGAGAATGVYFWKGTGLADTQAALTSVSEELSTAKAKLKTYTDAQEQISTLTGERDKLKDEIAAQQGKVTKLSAELIALKAKQSAEAPKAVDDKTAKVETKPDAKAEGTVEPKVAPAVDAKVPAPVIPEAKPAATGITAANVETVYKKF